MRRGLLLLIFALILCTAQSSWGLWTYETVATTGDQGQYASIALDSFDLPHIAWYDATNHQLMYGVRYFDGWDTNVVESGDVGYYTSIAINPTNDLPAIAYYDQGNEAAKYAYYSSGSWHTEFIENGDNPRGEYIHSAFKSDGTPYVSYFWDDGWANDNGVKVAWKSGLSWLSEIPDSTTNVVGNVLGMYTAIAISSADYPQIAYRGDTFYAQNQKYAYKDATGWHVEDATTPFLEISGEYSDIALDSGDNVYISMYNYNVTSNDCASVAIKKEGAWSLENVECGSGVFGQYTSIAIDSTDHPHVSYCGANTLQYGSKSDQGWSTETLDSNGSTGKYTGIALDSKDKAHIVYYSATAMDVKYVWDMTAPTVTGIDPDNGLNTGPITGVVITGSVFTPQSTAKLFHGTTKMEIEAQNINVTSGNELVCDFDITGAPVGQYDVMVDNQAGTGSLPNGFEITTLAPVLASIDPTTGQNDDNSFSMDLVGNYFVAPMAVFLQMSGHGSVAATTVAVNSLSSATATFNLSNMATGAWTVMVTTSYGSDTLEDAFEVTCGNPIADFTASPTSGSLPLGVQFTDATTSFNTCEVNAWTWDFGDSSSSTEQNPSHSYTQPGIYTVALTVTGPGGITDTKTKANYITVECSLPSADFMADVTTGMAPLTVNFTDLSTSDTACPIDEWAWGFGDGSIGTDRNPTHVYENPGTYDVGLRATNSAGHDDEIKTGYIIVTGPEDDDTGTTDDDAAGDDDAGDDDAGEDDDAADDDISDDDSGEQNTPKESNGGGGCGC